MTGGNGGGGGATREPRRKLRVVLADDHAVLRQALVSMLDQQDLGVVGEASDGIEAVDLCRDLRPDVVVMDLSMPRMDGTEATRIIAAELPDIRIVVLTMHDDPLYEKELREAGADAFVSKSAAAEELIAAIRDCEAARSGQ